MSIEKFYPKSLDTSQLSAKERLHLDVKDNFLPIPDLLAEGYVERADAVVTLHGFYVKELTQRYPQVVVDWMGDSERLSDIDLLRSALRGEDSILPSELAGRLIQSHQEALNKPLSERGLYPLYTEHELWAHELHPFFFLEAEQVDMVGDHIGFPMNKVIFGYEKDGKTPRWGTYGYLMMTEEGFRKEGALHLVLTEGETSLPKGQIQGRVEFDENMLRDINKGLRERGRAELPQELEGDSPKGGDKVKEFEFNDRNDTFFTILSLTKDDGRRMPLLFSRLAEDGTQGEVNLVRFTNGDFGFVVNPRYLINANAIEIPRGWSKQGEEKYAELRQETGLDINWGELTESSTLVQDPSTDYVFPTLSTVSFNKFQKMKIDPEYQKITDEGFEALVQGRFSPKETVQSIRRGLIYDSFSITGLTSVMLRSGELAYNPHYKPLNVVLERRYFLQQGNRVGLAIPRGPVGSGVKVGEVPPDTGKSRIVYQLERGDTSILERSERQPEYLSVPVDKAIGMMANLEFDVVTHSALAKGFIDRELLVHNFSE